MRLAAARAEWQRIRRGNASMRFATAWGLPDFKPPISGIDWLIKELRHRIGDGGFTTELELEAMGDEEEEPDAQAALDAGDGTDAQE